MVYLPQYVLIELVLYSDKGARRKVKWSVTPDSPKIILAYWKNPAASKHSRETAHLEIWWQIHE